MFHSFTHIYVVHIRIFPELDIVFKEQFRLQKPWVQAMVVEGILAIFSRNCVTEHRRRIQEFKVMSLHFHT